MMSLSKLKENELYNTWIKSVSRCKSLTHLELDFKKNTSVKDNHMDMKMLRTCLSDNLQIGKNLVELVCCGIASSLASENDLVFDYKPRHEVRVPNRMKDLKSVFE